MVKRICFFIGVLLLLVVSFWSSTWQINVQWINLIGNVLGLEAHLAKWLVVGVIDLLISVLLIIIFFLVSAIFPVAKKKSQKDRK